MKAAITAGNRRIEISRPDKVLFPQAGITKEHLAGYYRDMAELILLYSRDRPISMHRYPDGIGQEGFFQKEIPDYFPDWIDRVSVRVGEGGRQNQVMINKQATLVYLAGQASITPHAWLSRADRLDRPDRLIFDLDPPGSDFAPVRSAARLIRSLMRELGLRSFVMTTGSRGLHVVIPLRRTETFDPVRSFASDAAQLLARRHPGELTVEMRKNRRRGRVFLDFLRNSYGQTSVLPYTVRARPGAPVAAPLDWEELGGSGMDARAYNLGNIRRRLAQKDDPWEGMRKQAAGLGAARRRLEELKE
jgi:bifunctional non-homologous end joining protein LigD